MRAWGFCSNCCELERLEISPSHLLHPCCSRGKDFLVCNLAAGRQVRGDVVRWVVVGSTVVSGMSTAVRIGMLQAK